MDEASLALFSSKRWAYRHLVPIIPDDISVDTSDLKIKSSFNRVPSGFLRCYAWDRARRETDRPTPGRAIT